MGPTSEPEGRQRWLSPDRMVKRGSWIRSQTLRIATQETAMEYYAGIDVSLELASVCIVDANGKVVKETKVESHPTHSWHFSTTFAFQWPRLASRPVRCRSGSMPD